MAGKNVLIVDDEPVWVRVLRGLFEYYGYTAVSAASCAEGLEALRANRVDCAVLDFNLRDGCGDIICAAIRQRECGVKVPVIIFTLDPAAESCLSGPYGADRVVYKDAQLTELPAVMANLFRSRE